MKLSIIIISSSKNEEFIKMTQEAINSAKFCSDLEKEIIIVESEEVKFENIDKFISSKGLDMNYNHFLNLGILEASGEYLALCNNDLIFHKNWDKNIISTMKENSILSASPFEPKSKDILGKYIKGYDIGLPGQLYGWCIVISKEVLKKIGRLDEAVAFWCSDRIYAEQLKKHKIEHALVKDSIVEHLCSRSHKLLDDNEKLELTYGQRQKFKERINSKSFLE